MPIEFACESCKKLLRVPDGSGGLSCECPSCKTLLEIPDPDAIKVVEAAGPQEKSSNSLSIPCPKCAHELVCSADLVGTRGQCKNCQYIFTISKDGGAAVEAPSSGLFFTCPKCDQLFEGTEAMRGRKGKCHSCGEVFQIELHRQETTAADKPIQQTLKRAPAKPPASSKTSSRLPSKSSAKQAQPSKPAIQLVCTGCHGVMEVPASAAGQTTACPYCQQLLHIPDPNAPARPAPHPSGSASSQPNLQESGLQQTSPQTITSTQSHGPNFDDWTDLGDLSGAATNPYAAPATSYPSASAGGYAAPRSSNRRQPIVYILPGVSLILFGVMTLVMVAFGILNALRDAQQFAQMEQAVQAVVYITMGLLWLSAVVFAVLQLVGGIALIRRRGLTAARVGAIISCIPCLMCFGLNIPFGIWATVVCFTGSVKRDFD